MIQYIKINTYRLSNEPTPMFSQRPWCTSVLSGCRSRTSAYETHCRATGRWLGLLCFYTSLVISASFFLSSLREALSRAELNLLTHMAPPRATSATDSLSPPCSLPFENARPLLPFLFPRFSSSVSNLLRSRSIADF